MSLGRAAPSDFVIAMSTAPQAVTATPPLVPARPFSEPETCGVKAPVERT